MAGPDDPSFGEDDEDWDSRVHRENVAPDGIRLLRCATYILQKLDDEFVMRPRIEWITEPLLTSNVYDADVFGDSDLLPSEPSVEPAREDSAIEFLVREIAEMVRQLYPGAKVEAVSERLIRIYAPARPERTWRDVRRLYEKGTVPVDHDLERSGALAEQLASIKRGHVPGLYSFKYRIMDLVRSPVIRGRRDFEKQLLTHLYNCLLRAHEFRGLSVPVLKIRDDRPGDTSHVRAAARYVPAVDDKPAQIEIDPFLARFAFFYYCAFWAARLADETEQAKWQQYEPFSENSGHPRFRMSLDPVKRTKRHLEEMTQKYVSQFLGYMAVDIAHELAHHLVETRVRPAPGEPEASVRFDLEDYCDKVGIELAGRVFGFSDLDFRSILRSRVFDEGIPEVIGLTLLSNPDDAGTSTIDGE